MTRPWLGHPDQLERLYADWLQPEYSSYFRALGFSVIPITPLAKAPALLRWQPFQTTPATMEQTEAWWSQWPAANLAVVTGAISGITVIDLDGQQGEDTAKGLNLPRTFSVKTPKGRHLYYRYNAALHTGAGFLPGVDVRSDGGYVMAPPSKTPNGAYKLVEDGFIVEWRNVPDALKVKQRVGHHPRVDYLPPHIAEAMNGAPENFRNDTAAKLVGFFHRKGWNKEQILAVMTPYAHKCTPPMDLRELDTVIESVMRYPGGQQPGAKRHFGGIPE